ncbi:MAG: type II CRISPR-associated endonuclease Cas1 [Burkholderiaceae bacterium]|nr:type II CRISPR-associated endonuclease Cas1 [Burkholderiaceae bacterium]
MAGKDGADRLESYARRVRSGDTGRMEAQAAAFHFPQLFGRDFDRAEERWINAALDYGYAVLRGAIARGLVAHGLLPSVGLFHASEQNAFNLADDLIEPFRPLVDLHVARNLRPVGAEPQELSPADKVGLVALLNADVGMPQGRHVGAGSAIEQASGKPWCASSKAARAGA